MGKRKPLQKPGAPQEAHLCPSSGTHPDSDSCWMLFLHWLVPRCLQKVHLEYREANAVCMLCFPRGQPLACPGFKSRFAQPRNPVLLFEACAHRGSGLTPSSSCTTSMGCAQRTHCLVVCSEPCTSRLLISTQRKVTHNPFCYWQQWGEREPLKSINQMPLKLCGIKEKVWNRNSFLGGNYIISFAQENSTHSLCVSSRDFKKN